MDYYSQRLSEKKKTKDERLSKFNLPLGRPNNQIPNGQGLDNNLKTMAGAPQQPQQPQQEQDPLSGVEGGDFKAVFDRLSGDNSFKSGMAEFATIMKTMNKDMKGLNLPPEVLQKKVAEVMKRYQQGSLDADKAAMGSAVPQQQEQPMGEF